MNGWEIISRFPVPPYTRRIGWWLCTIFLTANVSTFKVGLGISRTNADSHGIRFTRHCIEFFVVKTKWFVRSNVNMILTLQNSSQYSSRAAGSKRIALEIYFYERVCHMFLMSRCRGGWDLWLCTFFGYLRKDNRCTMPNSNFFPRAKHFFFESCHCAAVPFTQVPKSNNLLLVRQNVQRTSPNLMCSKYDPSNWIQLEVQLDLQLFATVD